MEIVNISRAVGALCKESGAFPDVKSEADGALKVLHGYSLGLPPTYALRHIYIIRAVGKDGTVYPPSFGLSAELMASLIRRSTKYDYKIGRNDAQVAAIEFYRTENGKQKLIRMEQYGIADAQRENLTGRGNWIKDPKTMLFWACMRKGFRKACPELAAGFSLRNNDDPELGDSVTMDFDAEDMTDAELDAERENLFGSTGVDNDGVIVEAEVKPAEKPTDGKKQAKADLFGDPEPEREKPTVTAESIRDRAQAEIANLKKRYNGKAGNPASDAQLDYLRSLICKAEPDDQKQHSILAYLVGKTSTRDLTQAEASALISWLKGEGGGLKADGAAEAALCLAARLKEQGQQELFGEEKPDGTA